MQSHRQGTQVLLVAGIVPNFLQVCLLRFMIGMDLDTVVWTWFARVTVLSLHTGQRKGHGYRKGYKRCTEDFPVSMLNPLPPYAPYLQEGEERIGS